jgi:hypothetical protein
VKDRGRPRTPLDKSAFVYDEQRDCDWCPAGQPLTHEQTVRERRRHVERVRERDRAERPACAACGLRERCLSGKQQRREISHGEHERQRGPHRA